MNGTFKRKAKEAAVFLAGRLDDEVPEEPGSKSRHGVTSGSRGDQRRSRNSDEGDRKAQLPRDQLTAKGRQQQFQRSMKHRHAAARAGRGCRLGVRGRALGCRPLALSHAEASAGTLSPNRAGAKAEAVRGVDGKTGRTSGRCMAPHRRSPPRSLTH
ncbi:hypothetical protein MTO96_001380 [Rhipicephalus appendiculatus]